MTADHEPAITSKPFYLRLHWQIFAAMILGVIAGTAGGEPFAEKVGWLGTLFIRLLRMIIVPLVISSIVSGVASVGSSGGLGRLFGKTFGYYVFSSLLAVIVGLIAVNVIRPGVGADFGELSGKEVPKDLATPSGISDLLLDIVPKNVVDAAAKADMLAVIFFTILFGLTLSTLEREHRERLVGFFDALFHAMMKLTGWIIALAPIGVFGLMTQAIAAFGVSAFEAMAKYMATIAVGLTVHIFITLPLLLYFVGRINPLIHFRNMTEPLALAFSTSSSAATLPVTLQAVEKRVGVSNRVTSFVLPMGATVNMDGTALYECAGVLFIAQALGIELTIAQQGLVVLTALLASIGAAAVPSAGLVIIFIVLEAVDLRGPQVELLVGFMLAVDRPLDMMRTAVNVFSDSCGAAIIARSEGETEVDAEARNI